MEQNILIQFIKNHPALNISEIAKKAGFSRNLLYGILDGEKKLLTEKAFNLAKVLSHYGLNINDWIFVPYNEAEHLNTLECYRFTQDEHETIEETIYNKKGIETGCTIKYKVTIQKDMMDMFDFARLINL